MNWRPATEQEFLMVRQVSSDKRIEMGVYPVIYGARVRCGFVGSMSCHIDWCAGSNDISLKILYSLCYKIIGDRLDLEDAKIFEGIPGFSDIKPWTRDVDFTNRLASLAGPFDIIELPSIVEIRTDFFKDKIDPTTWI